MTRLTVPTALSAWLALAGCDANEPDIGESDATSDSGTSSAGTTSSGTGTGGEADLELDALANLRKTLAVGSECGDLRKLGATENDADPGIVVVVNVPPQNQAEPAEMVAKRTYVLPEDAELLNLRAYVGVDNPADHNCLDPVTQGTAFTAISGTIHVSYDVVEQGCIFTCERLFVEADNLVFHRPSDDATVPVEKLFIPPWADPAFPP